MVLIRIRSQWTPFKTKKTCTTAGSTRYSPLSLIRSRSWFSWSGTRRKARKIRTTQNCSRNVQSYFVYLLWKTNFILIGDFIFKGMATFQVLTEKFNSNTNPVVDHNRAAVRKVFQCELTYLIFSNRGVKILFCKSFHRHTQWTVFATNTEMGWRTYSSRKSASRRAWAHFPLHVSRRSRSFYVFPI
jgi:hypothetical protein